MTFFDPYFERDIEDSLIIVFFIYYSSNPQKYWIQINTILGWIWKLIGGIIKVEINWETYYKVKKLNIK